jgi:hypothetical protein
MSAAGREERRGAAAAWAELGRARGKEEKERERLGRNRPNGLKEILKTFSIKIIREMMFHLLKILPLLK